MGFQFIDWMNGGLGVSRDATRIPAFVLRFDEDFQRLQLRFPASESRTMKALPVCNWPHPGLLPGNLRASGQNRIGRTGANPSRELQAVKRLIGRLGEMRVLFGCRERSVIEEQS